MSNKEIATLLTKTLSDIANVPKRTFAMWLAEIPGMLTKEMHKHAGKIRDKTHPIFVLKESFHLFVTPLSSAAASDVAMRDIERSAVLANLRYHDGDAQDVLVFMKASSRPIRLIFQGFAGLTTMPQFFKSFVAAFPQLAQVTVDHGHRFEDFSRYQLLLSSANIFNCQTLGPH
ncbi:hypothetical protein BC940DRAFT_356731 [Gongronella butleri]|nr:hypothetical protein BC940DRAFT_356731 [Gongronella butleri]